jgi:hypothetical protein
MISYLPADITLCGQWAGNQADWDNSCSTSTGVSTCSDFVKTSSNFLEAYWEVGYIQTFTL